VCLEDKWDSKKIRKGGGHLFITGTVPEERSFVKCGNQKQMIRQVRGCGRGGNNAVVVFRAINRKQNSAETAVMRKPKDRLSCNPQQLLQILPHYTFVQFP
jgi:hypothetical protein